MSRLRNLTSGEVEMLSTVYGDAIDYSLGCCVMWDVYARRDGKKTLGRRVQDGFKMVQNRAIRAALRCQLAFGVCMFANPPLRVHGICRYGPLTRKTRREEILCMTGWARQHVPGGCSRIGQMAGLIACMSLKRHGL